MCSWSARPKEISPADWTRLSAVYDDPNDIDLFSGGMAEGAHGGGVIGRTFACIVARQFKALKDGDR